MRRYKEVGQKARETWIKNIMQERGISYELGEVLYKEEMRIRAARGGSAPATKPRGFAAISHDRLVEISKKGGRANRQK